MSSGNKTPQYPDSFYSTPLTHASVEDLMIVLSLKSEGAVIVHPEGGEGQSLMTSIPNVGDEHQGMISKKVGNPEDKGLEGWKSYCYF